MTSHKIQLQIADAIILCCTQMMDYNDFVLIPTLDPFEWTVMTATDWDAIKQVMTNFMIETHSPARWLHLINALATELHRSGTRLVVPEHLIAAAKGFEERLTVFFKHCAAG